MCKVAILRLEEKISAKRASLLKRQEREARINDAIANNSQLDDIDKGITTQTNIIDNLRNLNNNNLENCIENTIENNTISLEKNTVLQENLTNYDLVQNEIDNRVTHRGNLIQRVCQKIMEESQTITENINADHINTIETSTSIASGNVTIGIALGIIGCIAIIICLKNSNSSTISNTTTINNITPTTIIEPNTPLVRLSESLTILTAGVVGVGGLLNIIKWFKK